MLNGNLLYFTVHYVEFRHCCERIDGKIYEQKIAEDALVNRFFNFCSFTFDIKT